MTQMKMKKLLAVFLAVLVIFTLTIPVFAEEGAADPGLNTTSLGALMLSVFGAMFANLKNIKVDDFLNLPANAMAGIVTMIFQVLKFLGVNLDGLYEKIGGILGGNRK